MSLKREPPALTAKTPRSTGNSGSKRETEAPRRSFSVSFAARPTCAAPANAKVPEISETDRVGATSSETKGVWVGVRQDAEGRRRSQRRSVCGREAEAESGKGFVDAAECRKKERAAVGKGVCVDRVRAEEGNGRRPPQFAALGSSFFAPPSSIIKSKEPAMHETAWQVKKKVFRSSQIENFKNFVHRNVLLIRQDYKTRRDHLLYLVGD